MSARYRPAFPRLLGTPCRPPCRGSYRPGHQRGDAIVGESSAVAVADAAGSIAFASPKSSTFTVPSGAHLDVGGLEIAVDDALLVRGFERFGDLLGDRQRFVKRNRPLRDAIGERRSFDELHHERRRPIAPLPAVDMRDMRMIERGEPFRFTLEA